MIKLTIMKNKISFLALIAIALNVNYVCASECIGSDCEFEPIEITQNIDTVDVLVPVQYEINWTMPYIQTNTEQQSMCEHDYNCPFDTPEECAVWYKKPLYKAAVTPRAPHISYDKSEDMVDVALANPDVSANNKYMSPLLERYKMLMNAGDACCTSGIVYKMRQNGANDSDVYEFLKNDANYFAITKRCLVMSDRDIYRSYSNGVTGQMVADVRDACLCKNRQWFDSLLQPFNDIYERVPDFRSGAFTYMYKDGLNRKVNVSVNEDVQKTIYTLSNCMK